ncbi:hypothetical protein pb186bvf_013601 [Paramecium bursaria]
MPFFCQKVLLECFIQIIYLFFLSITGSLHTSKQKEHQNISSQPKNLFNLNCQLKFINLLTYLFLVLNPKQQKDMLQKIIPSKHTDIFALSIKI